MSTQTRNAGIDGDRSSDTYQPPDRTKYIARDIIHELWDGLSLPPSALSSINLPGDDNTPSLPSSYKIGPLAQSTIALSGLLAALIHSLRNSTPIPTVTVPRTHTVIEFSSEHLYTLNNQPPTRSWGPIGGLHKTSDGHIRIHDTFPHHRLGTLALLNLPETAAREDVAARIADWAAIDLENVGLERGLAMYALRSYKQWDRLPQADAIDGFPIAVSKISSPGPRVIPLHMPPGNDKCLRGLRVVEMSRVIAAPVAGRTLAAHGADVIWVTSPKLPDIPSIDRDVARGKRTVQLDINTPEGMETLRGLIATCDVFIQGYRPGSLEAKGLGPEDIAKLNPGVVYASMSAFGPKGPWAGRRGYDSLVQTCSGMNVSEAEHFGEGEAARPTPCQALDHAGGYLLASGVMAALYKKAMEGGSWRVDVSLAGAMKYLRSLGQYEVRSGFEGVSAYKNVDDVDEEYLETRETGFGEMTAVRHSVSIEGAMPGWDVMPKPLGSDEARWL